MNSVVKQGSSPFEIGYNLKQQRDKGIRPLVGVLTRLIISKVVIKVLLGCSSRMKKWKIVKTSFTLEVTPRKSRVECGWDLPSPYVMCPCLHAQWSHILGLVRGGDKDWS